MASALERELDALVKDAAGKLRVQRKIEDDIEFIDRFSRNDAIRSCAGAPALPGPL